MMGGSPAEGEGTPGGGSGTVSWLLIELGWIRTCRSTDHVIETFARAGGEEGAWRGRGGGRGRVRREGSARSREASI